MKIYVIDTETDPFERGRVPKVFSCGLYDGERYWSTWGRAAIAKMRNIIQNLAPGVIYAHNGGKFDVYVRDSEEARIFDWFARSQPLKIINGRIVAGWLDFGIGTSGWEFRDSYAILPFALEKFNKTVIDYAKFEADKRESNRMEIERYQRDDCVDLHKLVSAFVEKFGNKYTIGNASMAEIKKRHKFERLTKDVDEEIRKMYYYGGRVQCFEKGVLKPNDGECFYVYDINQSYPHSMKSFRHPVSEPSPIRTDYITDDTYFVTVCGRNYNAFPVHTPNGLSFDRPKGIFSVTIHEYNAAVEYGLFEPEFFIECLNFRESATFDQFVDDFTGMRREAQRVGDKIGNILYKTVGNSGYGKFSQNPEKYKEYILEAKDKDMSSGGWERSTEIEIGGVTVWEKKAKDVSLYNVATGASITGAARSLLIRAIAEAKRPIYCDTDSIICEGLSGVEFDATKLGAWKMEASGNLAAVVGKKMYAVFRGHECVKSASKGVRLSPSRILRAARGRKVDYFSDAPTFEFGGNSVGFLKRTVGVT